MSAKVAASAVRGMGSAKPRVPVSGEVLEVGRAASPQFGGDRGLIFRVISVSDAPTYYGWAWITGYVLDHTNKAKERREIYVNLFGLRMLHPRRSGPSARSTPTAIPRQAAPRTRHTGR